jgi:hypothetical protein
VAHLPQTYYPPELPQSPLTQHLLSKTPAHLLPSPTFPPPHKSLSMYIVYHIDLKLEVLSNDCADGSFIVAPLDWRLWFLQWAQLGSTFSPGEQCPILE